MPCASNAYTAIVIRTHEQGVVRDSVAGSWCDGSSGLDFYEKNADKPFNIYSTIEYCGEKRSILLLCVRFNRETLLKRLFENETVQKTLPDWDIVHQAMFGGIKNKSMYTLLLEFYTPKLSLPSKKDISPFFSTPSDDDKDKFNVHFSDFPHQELWRLFIDGVKQQNEHGWLDYEMREPDFILAMVSGFKYIKHSITMPLNITLLKILHAECSSNVISLDSSHSPGRIRDMTDNGFRLTLNENASILGLIQLNAEIDGSSFSELYNHRFNMFSLKSCLIEKEVEKILKNYHQNILFSTHEEAHLYSIIELIIKLERLHPFRDANCRTLCILLLNRELIKNGFSPVILDNPNRFNGYSRDELRNEIVEGMLQFQRVKSGDSSALGINTKDIARLIRTKQKYHSFTEAQRTLDSLRLSDDAQITANIR